MALQWNARCQENWRPRRLQTQRGRKACEHDRYQRAGQEKTDKKKAEAEKIQLAKKKNNKKKKNADAGSAKTILSKQDQPKPEVVDLAPAEVSPTVKKETEVTSADKETDDVDDSAVAQ